jgi:DNA-binding MarR family transcriptional regulator
MTIASFARCSGMIHDCVAGDGSVKGKSGLPLSCHDMPTALIFMTKDFRWNISPSTYRALALFRYHIREYLAFSDKAARAAGLEPKHYELLLAVKGLPDGDTATVGTVASLLHLRHHSTVELIDRAESRGLVKRKRISNGRSYVLIGPTGKGERLLAKAVAMRLRELKAAGPLLARTLARLTKPKPSGTRSGGRKQRLRPRSISSPSNGKRR